MRRHSDVPSQRLVGQARRPAEALVQDEEPEGTFVVGLVVATILLFSLGTGLIVAYLLVSLAGALLR